MRSQVASCLSPILVQDAFVAACMAKNFPEAVKLLSSGASVNAKGKTNSYPSELVTPLAAAVESQYRPLVLHLLSLGADTNGDRVLEKAAFGDSADILQLLIDAGGDVNMASNGRAPLVNAVRGNHNRTAVMTVLLAEPSLDLTITDTDRKTAEEMASTLKKPAIVAMIRVEVRT